jgi:hypothetical protein
MSSRASSSPDGSLRVLHGPCNVGNQPWVLSRAERALGVRSDLVVNYGTWLGYPSDLQLGTCGRKSLKSIVARTAFAATAPFRYDVLHYYFGRSFFCWDDFGPRNPLWFADLRLARKLGRKVFMTLQGCDVRLSYASSAANEITTCHIGNCQAAPTCRASLDAARRDLIANQLPLLDRVFILNPELGHFVPGATFLPYSSVDIDRFTPSLPRTEGPIRIVHAPSDPHMKGTRHVLAAIEALRTRHDIDFRLVQNLPHEEALALYGWADIVVDQLLAGWYGGLAVEVMAMGKPVVCYIRGADLRHAPPRMVAELPILRATPSTLEADLERMIEQRRQWPDLGRQARAFVERWHDPARIAKAMLDAYLDPGSSFRLDHDS